MQTTYLERGARWAHAGTGRVVDSLDVPDAGRYGPAWAPLPAGRYPATLRAHNMARVCRALRSGQVAGTARGAV